MQIDQIYDGFCLIEEEEIKEIASLARIFRHEKTGARLLALSNDDDNKVFGVGFTTAANDSTGVAHIMEHCVLSGSRKYRTKEPFMDMLKGSLQTFLNAFTSPDRTQFPVASRNLRDFYNLMDVYLDAVFYPAIYEEEKIFKQEGWHYELHSPEGEIAINGVVYNEMKGAFANASTILFNELSRGLWPDTCYVHSSGGDPYVIPSLTYEQFLDFHRRHYHPSNAWLFLYGDMDIQERLAYLDREYLSQFEACEPEQPKFDQAAFQEPRQSQIRYSLASGEVADNKHQLAYVLSIDPADPEESLLCHLVAELVFHAPSSPLRVALAASGLAEDVRAVVEELRYTMLGIRMVNAGAEAMEDFSQLVEKSLEQIVKDGIPREETEAALNRMEFSLRECEDESTRGIVYFSKIFDRCTYGASPLEALRFAASFARLRERLGTSFIEDFIQRHILQNRHKLLLELIPDPGLHERKDAALAEELRLWKSGFERKQEDELVEATRQLHAFQSREDSLEAKQSIPRLHLSDVQRRLPRYELRESRLHDTTFLQLEEFTSGLQYLIMAFDLSRIDDEDLPAVALLSGLLGRVATEKYSYQALFTETYLRSGGISADTSLLIDVKDREKIRLHLKIYAKTSEDKSSALTELLQEILLRSQFNDFQRLKELILMQKSRLETAIVQNGHAYGRVRAAANFRRDAYVNERMHGMEYYTYLRDLLADFDSRAATVAEQLQNLQRRIFVRRDCLMQLTAGEEGLTLGETALGEMLAAFPYKTDEGELAPRSLRQATANEGIYASSDVQYVNMAYDFLPTGVAYSGKLQLLRRILSGGYLHNEIRAKGGAYGVGLSVTRSGLVQLSSYRDPQLKRSLDVFASVEKAVQTLSMSPEELENMKIGTSGEYDPPLTASDKGARALNHYISGQTTEELEAELADMLESRLEDLQALSSAFSPAATPAFICVIGSREKLEAEGDMLDSCVRLQDLEK